MRKKITLLVLLSFSFCSCGPKFHTTEIGAKSFVGRWVELRDTLSDKCILNIHPDGNFDAINFPIVDFQSHINRSSESGQWKLEDKISEGLKSRWILSLYLSHANVVDRWDVLDAADGEIELGVITDFDTGGYTIFQKQKSE